MSFHVPEQHRFNGGIESDASFGKNGQFMLKYKNRNRYLFIQASDGEGWEHVSINAFETVRGKRGKPPKRRMFTPNWEEMCMVKAIFWDDEDVVIQYHPRALEYVNNHPNVLHLWRPTAQEIPTPPPILVGYRNEEEKQAILAANQKIL